MTRALHGLPQHVRRRLVEALESGTLSLPCSGSSLRAVLGLRDGEEPIAEAINGLHRQGVSAPGCVAWLRALDELIFGERKPDLVWSGPEVPGLHARDTRRAFDEVLGSVQHSLWVCSYAYFDGPRAFETLARRMEALPELRVTLLLNIQRRKGDTSVAQAVVRRFADHFWGRDWPGSARPRIFYDPRSLDLDGPSGVLHAKAVVADDQLVLVTSANLTEAAFDRNIELGLLVRDSALALSVTGHFRTLIDRSLLAPLPSA